MLGAKRAVQLCCTSDLQRRSAPVSAARLFKLLLLDPLGQHDPAIPAGKDGQVAARCIASAQLAVLPCGHAPFAEVPEQFLSLVQPFLEKCGDACVWVDTEPQSLP